MEQKTEIIINLKSNLGNREESDLWIKNALFILENNKFGYYKEEIDDIKKKVSNIRCRDNIELAFKRISLRAQWWAYSLLNIQQERGIWR